MRWCRSIAVGSIAGSIFLAGLPSASARGPEWVREPGGELKAVTIDPDSAVYVTGSIWTPSGYRAWVVSKLGPLGGLAWRRTWRRPIRGWQETGSAIAVAPGGGVYVGGSAGRSECGTPRVMRLSASGIVLWRRELPNPECYGAVTGLDANAAGVVASITSQGCCADFAHDGYVQAMTPGGRLRWRTDLEAPGVDDDWDGARGVALGLDGHIYVAGEVDRGAFSGEGPLPDEDILLQRLSPGGSVEWTRVLADRGIDHDRPWDVDVRGSLIVVAGSVDGRRWQSTRAWLAAFDATGERRWSRRWGQGELRRAATSVVISPWGPIYVGADRQARDPALQRWTIDGNLVRERRVDASTTGGLADVAADRDVVLVIGRRVERWSR